MLEGPFQICVGGPLESKAPESLQALFYLLIASSASELPDSRVYPECGRERQALTQGTPSRISWPERSS